MSKTRFLSIIEWIEPEIRLSQARTTSKMIGALLTFAVLREANVRSMLADSLFGFARFTNIIVVTPDAHEHIQYIGTVAGEQASVSPPVGFIASTENDLSGWDYISQSTEFAVTTWLKAHNGDWSRRGRSHTEPSLNQHLTEVL